MGDLMRCVQCGNQQGLRRATIAEERTVAGVTFLAELEAEVCGACGESYVHGNVLEKFELAIAAELAKLGRCTPEAFKFMRKVLAMRAIDLAKLLDVAPETVSRWENRGLPVEPRAFALLGILVSERRAGRHEAYEHLLALQGPASVTEPVRLNVA